MPGVKNLALAAAQKAKSGMSGFKKEYVKIARSKTKGPSKK